MKAISVERVFHCLGFMFLPFSMALLFALQNQVFNLWLGLADDRYSSRLLFASFALGLIIYGPSLFFGKRGKYIYLFLASFFVSFIFLAQFLYFSYGESFVQVSALRYAGQATTLTGTVLDLVSFKLVFFVSQFFLAGAALALTYKKGYLETVFSKKEKVVLFFILIAVAFSGYYFLIREEKQEWGSSSRLYKDVYDLNTLVEKIGIVNFTLEDTFKFIARSNLVTADDKQFLAYFAKSRPAPVIDAKSKPNYFGVSKGKNIIFIQIESLENAVINQSINGQQITPNLNRLVAQGLYFPNYYTQVGPGNTADAEFSTLDSLYPLPDDVAFVDYAQNNYKALPKLLVENGYHTYALHGDVPMFWNRSNVYPNLGYQQQISENEYAMTRPVGHGPSPLGDQDFLSQSAVKMEQFKQPFFATVITESSHTPFELPQDLQTLIIPKDTKLNYTQQQYLQSIHYMDAALGDFINQLQREDFYKNSVIFMYGDHQSFTNISSVVGNPDTTFPALSGSQVPLVVVNSGIAHSYVQTPASHIDLCPTILNLLGLPPLPTVLGQDVFNAKTPVVTRRNIFSGTINTILTDKLAFKSNPDGLFADGTCLSIPAKSVLPATDCQELYQQQANTVRASDIIVRGNLLDYLAR